MEAMNRELQRLRSLDRSRFTSEWIDSSPQRRIIRWFCGAGLAGGGVARHSWWILIPVLLAGCSDDRGLRPTGGVVTFKDQPVPKGVITFYPTRGRPASAKLNASGEYQLASFDAGDGVTPGEYRVTIKAVEIESGSDQEYGASGKLKWLVPPQYSDIETSPLQVTVTDKSTGNIDFDLPVAASSAAEGD